MMPPTRHTASEPPVEFPPCPDAKTRIHPTENRSPAKTARRVDRVIRIPRYRSQIRKRDASVSRAKHSSALATRAFRHSPKRSAQKHVRHIVPGDARVEGEGDVAAVGGDCRLSSAAVHRLGGLEASIPDGYAAGEAGRGGDRTTGGGARRAGFAGGGLPGPEDA